MTEIEKVLKSNQEATDKIDKQAYKSIRDSIWYHAYKAVWLIYPARKKTRRFNSLVRAIENKDLLELKRLIIKYRLSRMRDKLIAIYNEIWS